jgi:serine/threonine-protein kinase
VLAKDKNYLTRFVREAELAATLDHDNIVKGYGVGESNGLHYFAMEYVDGENVQQMLSKVPEGFPEDTALQIILPIARALQHAHYHGLLHQDVKPENILIDRKGTAKLLDLGLARRSTDVVKVRLGTPLYASPEQITGNHPQDIRSDIYSLGATLFHMLTGRPPFVGKDDKDTMALNQEEELPWPQDFNPELSDNVCQVISRMLVKDPAFRYGNPKEVIYDLEALLDDRTPMFALKDPSESKQNDAPPRDERPQRPRRGADDTRPHGRQRRGPRRSRPARQQQQQTDPNTIYVMAAIGIVVLLSILVIVLAVGS